MGIKKVISLVLAVLTLFMAFDTDILLAAEWRSVDDAYGQGAENTAALESPVTADDPDITVNLDTAENSNAIRNLDTQENINAVENTEIPGDIENPDDTESPDNTENAVQTPSVSNATAVYKEEGDHIVVSYERSQACASVKITVNGRTLVEQYTHPTYDFTEELTQGMGYEFQIIPYDSDGNEGAPVSAACTVPYKKAVITSVDVDYDLEKNVLSIEWDGNDTACVDVYQDNGLLIAKTVDNRILKEAVLAPESKHIYRIVPYNKNQEQGTEKSCEITVDDYVAKVESLNGIYDQNTKQVNVTWDSVYTNHVSVYLNEELLAENYKENSYVLNTKLQPGASYIISVIPYNYKNEEGEGKTDDVSFGNFDIPDKIKLSLDTAAVTGKSGRDTAFSRPVAQVSWDAQKNGIYEIYRAGKDKPGAYTWIGTAVSAVNGRHTYSDKTVGIGTWYYKVRRKIAEDDYISQEIFTSLSDAKKIKVSVPDITVKAQIGQTGKICLSMKAKGEFVSGYEIYRKINKGKYEKLAEITEDTYVDSQPEFGMSCCYQVKPFYYDVDLKKRNTGKGRSVKIKNTVGSMELKADVVSKRKVRLSWTPAANAEKYEVYFKSDIEGDSYVLCNTTEKVSLIKKLPRDGNYSFLVKAYRTKQNGKTYFSTAEVSCTLGFCAPTNFQVKKTTYQMSSVLVQKDKLSWNRVYGAEGYYLECYDPQTKKYKRIKKIKGEGKNSCTVTNPVTAESGKVKYRISAFADNVVKKGENLTVQPRLATVEGVKAVVSKNAIKIKWKPALGAERYLIYRSNGRTMQCVANTKKTSVTDKGLEPGVTYRYYVKAVNDTTKLTGENSLPAEYRKLPAAPSKLKAQKKADGKVKLKWKGTKDAEGYIVYCKTDADSHYIKLAEVKGDSYLHVPKETKNEYCYKVTAFIKNSSGLCAESEGIFLQNNP